MIDLDKNPFRIPDLTPMYEAVRDYVKAHQGKKGFICTDDDDCDTIWTIVYSYDDFRAYEFQVKAVRVDKHNNLQIAYDTSNVIYTNKSINLGEGVEWCDVQYDDYVYYIPTIFNLAENIREYVE